MYNYIHTIMYTPKKDIKVKFCQVADVFCFCWVLLVRTWYVDNAATLMTKK